MNFKGEIIDFISQSDSAVIQAVHKRDINERMETFDFTILSERTTYMQERNRIIIQDKNGQYREFIIDRISADIDGYTEIETVASYLEDITKARPYAPGKLEKMTTKQALSDVLKDTGWEVSDATEYGGLRTTSWTSYQTRYDVLLQLCTTYGMMADFYIEVGSNRVDKRLVVLRKRNPLFKGKEITYGKDLTGLKRTVDFSEIKTALLCVGPEPEEGKKRLELVVKDDEAQAKYGLPGRYNWAVYEPETDDQNMTEARLRTLGTTELNKRKSEVISYEVTAVDIEKEFKHEIVNLGDKVRIKDREFTPPLYVEAEVISEEYDMIAEDVVYGFGEYVEYREKDLRDEFTKKLGDIRSKLNDSISNINTIVKDSVDGQLEYFERKIIKSATPPENPVNDMLWLDISNPDIPVLKRYWNGQWILASVDDVEKIGGITREKALFSELKNTFVNLSIQHSKLLKEMYEILSSEYLVDEDLKKEVNSKLDATIEVYNQIKANLESMTEDTATIGKLIDTQALFLTYRQKLQDLYNSVEKAKLAIEKRFKLLQSQYTDEKFNDAMTEIANVLPNGHWDPDTKQLTSDIPNKDDLEQMRLKLIESLEPINDRIESIQKEVKNYENGMELTIDKKIKEYNNGSGNIYRYSNPLVFKEADYYKATSITNEPEKSIRYNYKTEINFGALDYYKWEVGKPYTFSFTIKVDTPFVVVNTLNDGNKLHPAKLEIPSNEWQRKSITFIPESEDSSKGITLNLSIDTGDSGIEWAGIVGTGSSIGVISVKDFQLEKGDEASPQKPNVNDLDESYKYITNKVIQSTAKISAFEDRINLKADKSEVAQTLDEKLQPIKNEVQQQNANIELLPNKLTEQVSQHIYETTISGLVKRLEAEESKRETLANQINDTVSIRQYQAGIQEAKEYAEEQLKDVANAPGIREGIAQANEEAQESLRQYINAQDALKQQESQAYIDGQISAEEQRAINEAKQKLAEAKRHAEDKANEAQRLSNSYTDGQIRNANRERDQILTRYDSQIQQNGREIALRTTKQEFNATNRTLSNIMSEIVQNVTTGATIRFDDNGTAQSLNVGPQGIQLNGDKINLNASRQFNLLVSDMRNKVDKNAVISSINASPERVDINTQNIGIRGGSGQSYVDIRNDQIELSGHFNRTWRGNTQRDYVYTRLKDGHLRFRNNNQNRSLYYSDFGISTYLDGEGDGSSGTLQFFDYTYSSNARGVTLNSSSGVVALRSDNNRVVLEASNTVNIESKNYSIYLRPMSSSRLGRNEFQFWVKDNDAARDTDGVLSYGSITSGSSYGSGIRFDKSANTNYVYATNNNGDIGTGDFYANRLLGDWTAKGDNVYACVDDKLRVTDKRGYNNGNTTYKNLQVKDIQANSIRVNTGANFYLGVTTGELRVTNNLLYNGGNIGYKPVRASAFNNASLAEYKKDIKLWNYDALSVITNDLELYQYKYKDDSDQLLHRGVVIGDGYATPSEFIFGDGVNLYEMLTWSLRAIQQLNDKINKLEEDINEQLTS